MPHLQHRRRSERHDARRIVAIHLLVEFGFWNVGDAEGCLLLTLGHTGIACYTGAADQWAAGVPLVGYPVATLLWLDLLEQFPRPSHGPRSDPSSHALKLKVFGLAGIGCERSS